MPIKRTILQVIIGFAKEGRAGDEWAHREILDMLKMRAAEAGRIDIVMYGRQSITLRVGQTDNHHGFLLQVDLPLAEAYQEAALAGQDDHAAMNRAFDVMSPKLGKPCMTNLTGYKNCISWAVWLMERMGEQ